MSSETSILQLMADIQATADDIDARLRAIEIGDVSDILWTVWKIAHDEMEILQYACDSLENAENIDHAADILLYDARRPAWTIYSALSVLLDDEEFSAELSASVRQDIQQTQQVAGHLNNLLDELHTIFRGG